MSFFRVKILQLAALLDQLLLPPRQFVRAVFGDPTQVDMLLASR
jgi:hypothetical protein